jgi:hypothetical protein
VPRSTSVVIGLAPQCRCLDRNGAAQESNLPSVGLRRRTGFEGLAGEVQLATEAAFADCSSPLGSG